MIPRTAAARLSRLLKGFPVVTVTGPRQSGKTTLVRALLPQRPYVSLESPKSKSAYVQRAKDTQAHIDRLRALILTPGSNP